MRRPLVVPRSPPPAVTSRRTLMGLIGSDMCLSDVTCPQPPAEHPLSRITKTAVLLSLVRAPALPPRHAYFGSQSEPRRVSRRLQLLRGWSHGNQEDSEELLA